MNPRLVALPSLLCVLALSAASQPAVTESARKIPVAYDVDVLVVGGSTGAVAAAEAAAKAGAKVFLATNRLYLGEDVAGTLRLWLEDGETPESPLARKLYAVQGQTTKAGPRGDLIAFAYQADKPSDPKHRDTRRPSRLADGKWGESARDSVQYNEDVTLTLDLGKRQDVAEVTLVGYQRPTESPFHVAAVTVSVSDDGRAWKVVKTVKNADLNAPVVSLGAKLGAKVRHLRLRVEGGEKAERILLGEILVTKPVSADAPKPVLRPIARPLHVKKTLDETLLAAGVKYLFGCFATDVVRDGDGNPCGIVMANRAGRQAVVAKVIVDATDRAWVARLAGARFRPYPAGSHAFERVVIGGKERTGEGVACVDIQPPLRATGRSRRRTFTRSYAIHHYSLKLAMKGGSYASWAEAEQIARDRTFSPGQQFASDILFQVPPDPVEGQKAVSGVWGGVGALDIGAFRPAGVPRLFVLGGCADIPRDQAAKLLRPIALIDMGSRVGAAAAAEAKPLPAPKGAHVPGSKVRPVAAGEVAETLVGVRPVQELPTIERAEGPLPVLGRYDVVVIGGGTGGAPAAIAAARQGAKTLVVEILHGLGGVGTLGHISSYYWGNRGGFTKTVPGGASWAVEDRAEWWRSEIRKAGGDIWFASCGCGAFVERGRVKGAVVATPQGRGVVLAKVVVDSTGNADIAASAGAACIYTDGSDIAVQGTGLPPRRLGASYTNTDFTITDETDMVDVWHTLVYAKYRYGNAFDAGQLIDTRERRRIVGSFVISPLDQLNRRTFPDTIAVSWSNFDSHGYTIHPFFALRFPDKRGWRAHMPYRAFLPKALDGILVTGLGVSAHRDAIPVIRMQPDIQNHGYAIGVAAAMAAKLGGATRKIDIKALQRHLVKTGNLPKSVLTDTDSYPMPTRVIAAAVKSLKSNYAGAEVVLADPAQALPLLRGAYEYAPEGDKLIYAHVLAIMGDATGLPTLIDKVNATTKLDQGWDYRAMGQFGASMSRLDSYVMALGRTRDRKAAPAIVRKLALLDARAAFSHHRAVARALGLLRDARAAGPLAALLAKPGMRGHAVRSIGAATGRETKTRLGLTDVRLRRQALRELMLAAALYLCGDHNGLGKKVLLEYAQDLRGHLSRHARAVLDTGSE